MYSYLDIIAGVGFPFGRLADANLLQAGSRRLSPFARYTRSNSDMAASFKSHMNKENSLFSPQQLKKTAEAVFF